ncbi:MAG: hypothetical protein AB1458_13055, partial [Bacteroidota bacterium]
LKLNGNGAEEIVFKEEHLNPLEYTSINNKIYVTTTVFKGNKIKAHIYELENDIWKKVSFDTDAMIIKLFEHNSKLYAFSYFEKYTEIKTFENGTWKSLTIPQVKTFKMYEIHPVASVGGVIFVQIRSRVGGPMSKAKDELYIMSEDGNITSVFDYEKHGIKPVPVKTNLNKNPFEKPDNMVVGDMQVIPKIFKKGESVYYCFPTNGVYLEKNGDVKKSEEFNYVDTAILIGDKLYTGIPNMENGGLFYHTLK